MENQLDAGYPAENYSGIHLQLLVNSLVNDSLPAAQRNQSAVINEVGKGVVIEPGNSHMIALLGDVIKTIIHNSKRGDIHIGAEKAGNKLVMKIQERNNYNGLALSFSLGTLIPDINFAGGQLDIDDPRKRVTTVYFSFPDRAVA
jgi:hypothetical protein